MSNQENAPKKKMSRRKFLLATGGVIGGGLVVGFASLTPQHKATQKLVGDKTPLLSSWIKITEDNKVQVIVPHIEMGQGSHTSLPMMAADEMDADWDLVSMEQAPAHAAFANEPLGEGFILGGTDVPDVFAPIINKAFFQIAKGMELQITGGSTAVRFTGQYGMRVAGAAAREMLIKAASETWDIPEAELTAEKSFVLHKASGKRASFGELARKAATYTPNPTPTLKTKDQFTIMGTSKKRFDIPGKVNGTAVYGIDAEVEGMMYGAIRHVPVFDCAITEVDSSAASNMPGVTNIVRLDNAVVVVADKYWRAKKALDTINITHSDSANCSLSSDDLYKQFAEAIETGDPELDVDEGDAAAVLSSSSDVISADYRVPYLAHATMEPMNCTVRIQDGKVDIWTGTQTPITVKSIAAKITGIDIENITYHPCMLGGGFGRRVHQTSDYVAPAVKVAMEVGAPVKLIYSREEDMQQDAYRPALLSRFKAVVADNGAIDAWHNLYTDKNEPAEAPIIPYAANNNYTGVVRSTGHVPFGPWRSVDHSQHAFFIESFVDELADKANIDPYEFRMSKLKDKPRHAAVLKKAAEMAGWQSAAPEGRYRGIALHESFGSIVAEVAEISITDGSIKVHKVSCAVDCGFPVNPDSATAQVESGVIYGLSAALFGEITIENGRVVQENFPDYDVVRLAETPDIQVEFIDSGKEIGGLGEPATPPIAPAVMNAVFAATGKRIRSLPLINHSLV
ncbi:molybdopterin cofactor-binding domain-containing protein [Kordiimonas sp. SCSIO 12610]|uniref:xanthine dehydrogenase family protein molybdopterin-binding subunit n=1 Tax=Kordiimonas sp. SCSIO 12610 TaxID=2829597 RepID=UPI002109F232|nr:molybdopterin cofactor-binding domain-containing protein [Kordiimonas sp. SCSIO 12610]UTW53945.1 xanthine dehydrogenase family protein molybdopterin-binding subunit [Kordiimonas sp. SCSIO 12610]